MPKNFFKTIHSSSVSKARLGEINTVHGIIKTPAFVPVATKGTIKSLPPEYISKIGIQTAFVNTYHLVTHPGVDIIEKAGGIHKFSKLEIPLMSDSGGFQVFSLANSKFKMKNAKLQLKNIKANVRGEEKPLVIKISEDGVKFRSTYDGGLIEFTPEKSIEFQKKIGADLMMAFDECTYYPADHNYAEKAMKRTHDWLSRCIEYNKNNNYVISSGAKRSREILNSLDPSTLVGMTKQKQYIFGIIQGATFEDLRKKSAEFVCSKAVDGVAIGGVSVGETKVEMRDQVRWVSDYLPKDKPVHLLGVGQIDDIVELVKYGIDTFDCVEPTRLARMGTLYKMTNVKLQMINKTQISNDKLQQNENIDITKSIYKADLSPVDESCKCYVCSNFTKAYLHHLFKQREILGYTLATYHNLYSMERLMGYVREMIEKDKI